MCWLLTSGLSLLGMFHSLVSVAAFGYYESVVAMGSLIGSASEGRWVAEKNSDGWARRKG